MPWRGHELVAVAQDVAQSQHQPPNLRSPAAIAEEVQHHPVQDPLERVIVDRVHGQVRQPPRGAPIRQELVRNLGHRVDIPAAAAPRWREPVRDRDRSDRPIQSRGPLAPEPPALQELP